MYNIEVFTHVESQGLTPVSFDEFLKNSFNDDGNIHKRNNNIEPIFYLQFEEPFNGEVSIDLFFNGNIYSEIPSNYFIEIYFNDGSNLALSHYLKQFPLQKNGAALKRFVKKYINKNNQALGKCKKVFNILGQDYEKYVVHHMQTVPHGDRLHFSQVFKIYYKNKKLNIDLIKN